MNENISKAVDFAFSNNISEMGKEIEGALMQKVSDALAGKRIEVAQTLVQNETEEPVDEFEDEDLEEGLTGKQHKLDKNKNGKLDSQDFKMLRKEDQENKESFVNLDRPKYGWKKSPQGTENFHMDQKHVGKKIYFYGGPPEGNPTTHPQYVKKGTITHSGLDSGQLYHQIKFDDGKHSNISHNRIYVKKSSQNESYIEEVLKVSDGVDAWIKDFVHSDNPKFEGKSKKERIKQALAAFYAAKKDTNEEVEDIQELSKETLQNYVNKRQWDMGANEKAQKKMDTGLDRAEKKIKRKLKIGQ